MYYKAPDNSLHCIDPSFAHILPSGCVAITQTEAEELQKTGTDDKVAIQAQIAALEQQINVLKTKL